jgi:hypothetical protein
MDHLLRSARIGDMHVPAAQQSRFLATRFKRWELPGATQSVADSVFRT